MNDSSQNPSRITFTELERQLVRELVAPEINLLDSKKNDAISSRRKQEAWNKVAAEYNASKLTHNKATPLQLKRLWANMKARAQDFRTKESGVTGAGPFLNVADLESEHVLSIMPHIVTTTEVAHDSDTLLDNTELGDNDNEGWQRKRFRPNTTDAESGNIVIDGIFTNTDFSNEPDPLADTELRAASISEPGPSAPVQQRVDSINEPGPSAAVRQRVASINEPGPSAGAEEIISTISADPLQTRATATITGRQIRITPKQSTEDLKMKLINDDINYRKKKAEEELRYLKEANEIKLKIIQEEFKALKEKNLLDIEEKKNKIAILEKQLEKADPLQTRATATITGKQIRVNPKQSIEDLKMKLINDDINYKKKKSEEELRYLKEANEIKLKIIQEEFKALKEKNLLDIEEKKIKIAILKKDPDTEQ